MEGRRGCGGEEWRKLIVEEEEDENDDVLRNWNKRMEKEGTEKEEEK